MRRGGSSKRTGMTETANPGKIMTQHQIRSHGRLGKSARRVAMVSFSNRVVIPAYVLVRHLDGESVLLNLETEKYFGLDAMATRMWELLTQLPNIEVAFETLSHEFDVEPELLRAHLGELLGQLVENGLLTVMPSDVASVPAI
jgi:hypothetical protein